MRCHELKRRVLTAYLDFSKTCSGYLTQNTKEPVPCVPGQQWESDKGVGDWTCYTRGPLIAQRRGDGTAPQSIDPSPFGPRAGAISSHWGVFTVREWGNPSQCSGPPDFAVCMGNQPVAWGSCANTIYSINSRRAAAYLY